MSALFASCKARKGPFEEIVNPGEAFPSKEIGAFVQDWRNSDFDLFASANGGNPDPDGYFYRTFYGGGSTNVFKWRNC